MPIYVIVSIITVKTVALTRIRISVTVTVDRVIGWC